MAAWDDVYDYLQPKTPLYCPEEPSVTQKVFLRTDSFEALFGGAVGGGKSSALLMAALQYVDVPGYAAMLFRKTYSDLALPGALMDRFVKWIAPYDEIHWNASTYMATFPSGARITFGYLNNVNDRFRYKSTEFQFIGMDEVTEIRKRDYEFLFSRLRRPESGPASKIPLRMRAASNPAPNWVRQRFIVEGETSGRVFVKSLLEDNPGIDKPAYRRALQELDPVERRRMEFGDWWITSLGTLFDRADFEIIEAAELPTLVAPKVVRYWDYAGSVVSSQNPDPDWTVGTLMLWDQGIAYIIDVARFRAEGPALEKRIQEVAAVDGVTVPIHAEQEPGSAGKTLKSHFSRNVLPGYAYTASPSSGSKPVRARPYAAAVANGNVKLVRGSWLNDFLDEHASFPEAALHDDQVDSAAGAFNFLTGLGGQLRKKVNIIV